MIGRSPSGTIRSKTTIENVTVSLGQKDKMVDLLKRELEGFKNLRQDYDRLRDRKTHLLDKCDTINRQITLNRQSQNRKATSDLDMVQDLASVVLSLEKDLQNKNYHLKTLKCQTQTLLASSDKKDQDLTQCLDKIESVKETGETIKLERDRLRIQLNAADQDISKITHSCHQSMGSNEKVRNQIHNTQSFIRSLQNQQLNIGNKLSHLEDQNNALDAIIEDLESVLQLTKQKCRESKQNKENVEFKIQSKKLQKGRIDTEHSQKHKKFKMEREREKKLKEQIEMKKSQNQRVSLMNKQIQEETEQILSSNLQIEEINGQLKVDLQVCKKHLQNVMRVNANVQDSLQQYKKTNMVVIKKLKKPIDEGWSEINTYAKSELAESTSENFNVLRT